MESFFVSVGKPTTNPPKILNMPTAGPTAYDIIWANGKQSALLQSRMTKEGPLNKLAYTPVSRGLWALRDVDK